jgi:hypothetical protein
MRGGRLDEIAHCGRGGGLKERGKLKNKIKQGKQKI